MSVLSPSVTRVVLSPSVTRVVLSPSVTRVVLSPSVTRVVLSPSVTRVVAEPRASVLSPVMRTVPRNDRYRLARGVQTRLPPGRVRRRRHERGDCA
jgi:hypothetical protein